MLHEIDEVIGRNRLARLMREHGLLARGPRRFRVTTGSAQTLPVARNLLKQDCYDNAVAESFFASLKKECLNRVHLATRTEAYDGIAAYIDGFYNPVRRHSGLGYLSPIHCEAARRCARGAA